MKNLKKFFCASILIAATAVLSSTICYAANNGAGNESNHGFAVSDGTYVYYSADGNLYRENAGGGSKKTLLEESSAISNIVLDGDYIYYFRGQAISKVRKDGSNKQFVTYAGGIAVPPNTYIIDGYIYYSYVNSFGTSTIHKMELNSGDDMKLATSSEAFTISGDKIYFSNDDSNVGAVGLASIDLNGNSFKTFNEGTAVSINAYNGNLYYTKNKTIYKIPTSGGDAKALCNANTTYINVYKNYIYFRENGKLTRVSVDGGEKQTSDLSVNSIICLCEDRVFGRSTDGYGDVEIDQMPDFKSSSGGSSSGGSSSGGSSSSGSSSGGSSSSGSSSSGSPSGGSSSGGSSSGGSSSSGSSSSGSSNTNKSSGNSYTNISNYSDMSDMFDCFDAVNVLSEFGIISGFEDGTYRPHEYVTRAQFAKLVVEALNEREYAEANSKKTKFYDVSSNHWANGYINQGVADAFIAGYSESEFGPEDEVTYMQAMKMLVSAIGYETYSQASGGWPYGYKEWGDSLGIGDGVYAYALDMPLDRGEVAIMLYNAMNSPLCVIKNYNTAGQPTLEVKDGNGIDWQTLFTKRHNVYKVEGYEEGYNYFHITYAKNFVDKYYPSGSDEAFKISKIVHGTGEIENVPSIAYIKLRDSGKYEIPYMIMK